jgi:hypothetical protein
VVEHVGSHEDGKVERRELVRVRRYVGKKWPRDRKEEVRKRKGEMVSERGVHNGGCTLHGP